MTDQDRYWAYFDEAWKKIIKRFFPQLLQFFVPGLYEEVDFSKRITFLDKEMEQLSIKATKGVKYVDKLVRVHLKNGGKQWILVHIEVEGDPKKDFSLRMFRYFYKRVSEKSRGVTDQPWKGCGIIAWGGTPRNGSQSICTPDGAARTTESNVPNALSGRLRVGRYPDSWDFIPGYFPLALTGLKDKKTLYVDADMTVICEENTENYFFGRPLPFSASEISKVAQKG